MNLLTVAHDINAELAIIRARNSEVLSDQGRAEIFNSIVACLTDDLLTIIKMSVICKGGELLSWCYDLRNKVNIQRLGPDIEAIISRVNRVPENTYLTCQVQWSQAFEAMDSQTRRRILRNTIWNEPRDTLTPPPGKPPEEPVSLSRQGIDLSALEFDLRSMESQTGFFDSRMSGLIIQSVEQSLSSGYITGIQLLLIPVGGRPTIEWGFDASLASGLVRQGPAIETILATAKELAEQLKFEIKPILSVIFEQLSSEDKRSAMKETIWGSQFGPTNKGRWWSR